MAAEPEAMIAKAATHLTTVGAEKAYSGFTTSVECGLKDLRTLVNDMGSGLRMAHGANATLVGKVVRELKDRDGKFPNQVIEEVAKAKGKGKGKGWGTNIKFVNPLTKRMTPRKVYVDSVGGTLEACGFF